MTIEYRFLQKAIEDKNYISFSYENKKYTNVKAINLTEKKLSTNQGIFDFDKLNKIKILKERY